MMLLSILYSINMSITNYCYVYMMTVCLEKVGNRKYH